MSILWIFYNLLILLIMDIQSIPQYIDKTKVGNHRDNRTSFLTPVVGTGESNDTMLQLDSINDILMITEDPNRIKRQLYSVPIKIIRQNGKIIPVYQNTEPPPVLHSQDTYTEGTSRGKRVSADNEYVFKSYRNNIIYGENHGNLPGYRKDSDDPDSTSIVFPVDPDFKPTVPEDIKTTYSDQDKNYPTSHIETILRAQITKYAGLFDTDVELTVRVSDVDEEIDKSLCNVVEEIIYPKSGEVRDKSWQFIVNTDNYKQGVRVERCVGSNNCLIASFPNGYRAECKQKYIYRQLVGINSAGNAVKDVYKMPSCCQCVYNRVP